MSQEENKFIHDWDSIVIQLSKEEKVHGSIRMMKQDIDNIMFMQNMTRARSQRVLKLKKLRGFPSVITPKFHRKGIPNHNYSERRSGNECHAWSIEEKEICDDSP